MSKQKAEFHPYTKREGVVHITFEALIQELSMVGVNLDEVQLRKLKSGVFAAREPHLEVTKKVKAGKGDYTLLENTLFAERILAKHTASHYDLSNTTKLTYLMEWAEAAETLMVFKRPRDITYKLFCRQALELMGDNYGLNAIGRYKEKILARVQNIFVVEDRCQEVPVVEAFATWRQELGINSFYAQHYKEPEQFIHFIRIADMATSFNVAPSTWVCIQVQEEAKLGRKPTLAFMYNSIAIERVIQQLSISTKKGDDDAFLKQLNQNALTKRTRDIN